ncbi:MAG: SUF system NifU family Fe-S cluster assembly protein [Dehalococcoidia bacterium]|jgi:nitrogen fixation NifU-like protein|nr:SUF system NifU family Fe-S cluster assembly protein [Dehalococcoidia bacterium]MDP6227583.1 SUF system NifU family Fe-S cluster assembly protein [Dehalococcoidia bacterium]MDP7084777.1 SUF system NifU family Fe-S cluster assembly protein [Dehalococcoidia bacterium]MDP7201676.1 SUF system NifU family Fe-S cluster assembly protein [Dehalococcoidia bacterium]MDP7511548.1 SUF system NifU family Fe-S cluster assembly protein [Dehalococcoidia bacterium]|tara:strand:+ start:187 stop:636 length:450 start_codon:yes stop_codon:yes gene_type:complete
MTGVSDLYQEILLDHNSKPRNFRKPEEATHSVDGYNPLCGDKITLYLTVADGVITDVGFQGAGCAISKASASMLTQSIKGQSSARALEIFEAFHQMMTEPDAELDFDTLGDLESLSGVIEYPTRIKCAVLAWHAMRAALEGRTDAVTSE